MRRAGPGGSWISVGLLAQALKELAAAPAVAGVDLGSAFLKGVELTGTGPGVRLRRCVVLEIVGRDVVQALRELVLSERLGTTRVVVGIASPEAVVKPFRFPRMSGRELRAAMSLEAEQAILNGHTLSEMAVDWHLLKSDSKEFVRGLCAVVPRKALVERISKIRSAGFRPQAVGVEALALWKAYWTLAVGQIPAGKAGLVINVGARTTNLVIARGADQLILTRDFQVESPVSTRRLGKEWAADVRDSVRYAQFKGEDWELGAACVTGGNAGGVDLEALSEGVGLPVRRWNPLDHLKSEGSGPAVEHSAGPLLAVAIGLALTGMEQDVGIRPPPR